MSDLTFPEVSRALQALSATYVERRARLKEGAALAGAGKRAAFALYYGPLHYLLVHHIASTLGAPFTSVTSLADLGCGTGASGAGWAGACLRAPSVFGIDRHPWAVDEARRTYAALGLKGTARVGSFVPDDRGARTPGRSVRGVGAVPAAAGAEAGRRAPSGVLLAFAVNEVASTDERGRLLRRLIADHTAGTRVLVVEPLAGFVAPWWREWQQAFEACGGRSNEWRLAPEVPAIVEKLGRAAGLNYREVRGRSLSM